jgi:hypothetical protein
MITVVNASGNIKVYKIFSCSVHISIVIISYFVCRIGYEPQFVFVVPLIAQLPISVVRFLILKRQFNFPVRGYFEKTLLPVFAVSILSVLPVSIIYYFCSEESLIRSVAFLTTSILWTGVIILFIGLNKNERVNIFNFVGKNILMR